MRLLLIGGGTVSESQLNCQDFLNSCNEERSDETSSNIGGNMEKSSNITLRDIFMSYIANKISASQDISIPRYLDVCSPILSTLYTSA